MLRVLTVAILIPFLIACNRHHYKAKGTDAELEALKRQEIAAWQFVKEQDSSKMSKILAPDYRFLSSTSSRFDRTKDYELKVHFSGVLRVDSVRFDHWRSSWINKDAIVFHYTTMAWGAVRDSPLTQAAGVMVAWRRSPAGWQTVARTEWLIPEEKYVETENPDWIK